MRIFQNKTTGHLRTPGELSIAQYEAESEWVEVKVAPLDAIVIDRADLPPIKTVSDHSGPGVYADKVGWATRWLSEPHRDGRSRAEYARGTGLAYLALAEYLDAHPPVDEAQVAALRDALRAASKGALTADELNAIARALVVHGVRAEVAL